MTLLPIEADSHRLAAAMPLHPRRQAHVAGAPPWQASINRISNKLGKELPRKFRLSAFSSDNSYGVCCLSSKEYAGNRFWWNLRERQLRDLAAASSAFVAFACGTADNVVLIPLNDFEPWLPTFNTKAGSDGEGWHIHILRDSNNWWLLQTGRDNRINITQYVI